MKNKIFSWVLVSLSLFLIILSFFTLFPTQDGPAHFYTAYVLKNYAILNWAKACLSFSHSPTSNWVIIKLIIFFTSIFSLKVAHNLFVLTLLFSLSGILYTLYRKVDINHIDSFLLAIILSLNVYLFYGFYSFYLGTILFLLNTICILKKKCHCLLPLVFVLVLFFVHSFYFVESIALWIFYAINTFLGKKGTYGKHQSTPVFILIFLFEILAMLIFKHISIPAVQWVYSFGDRLKMFIKGDFLFPWSRLYGYYLLSLLFSPLLLLWVGVFKRFMKYDSKKMILLYFGIGNFILFWVVFDLLGSGSHTQIRFMYVAYVLLIPFSVENLYKLLNYRRIASLFLGFILLVQSLIIVKKEILYIRKINNLQRVCVHIKADTKMLYKNVFLEKDGPVNPLQHAALWCCIENNLFCPQNMDFFISNVHKSPQSSFVLTGRYPLHLKDTCLYNADSLAVYTLDRKTIVPRVSFDYLVIYGLERKYTKNLFKLLKQYGGMDYSIVNNSVVICKKRHME